MDPDRARELLARERARIEAELARHLPTLREGARPDGPADLADLGDATYDAERELGRIEDLRRELGAVERAEGRLEDGSYGLSIESGEPIPDARLQIEPTAERTVAEQVAFERRGRRGS